MDPGSALGTTAEVAATVAGFAGIVVVFGRRSVADWSRVDKERLRLLLVSAAISLVLSLLGMVFLAAFPSSGPWRWGSAFAAILLVGSSTHNMSRGRRFDPSDVSASGGSVPLFYTVQAAVCAVGFLQVYNAVVWSAFWPFFAGIVTILAASVIQFIRLVLSR